MKKIVTLSMWGVLSIVLFAFTPSASKLTSSKTHIKFFSSTPVENIEANNFKSVSNIDTKNGDVFFSVPMQSFEFEKALMQRHYNSPKFLDTKQFPKAKLIAKIINLNDVHFEKDGSYTVNIKGTLELHGKTNPISEKAIITVSGHIYKVNSKFKITLSDYDIAFEKGKPSTNIAKIVEVTVEAEYKQEH